MHTYRWKRWITPYLLLIPAVIIMLVFVYIPVVENIYQSLFRWSSIDPNLKYIGLNNYTRILSDKIIPIALRNNILYAVISIIFQVIFALILASILESRVIRPRWGTFFRSALFLPSVLAVTVVGITWQLIFSPNSGLLNQFLRTVGMGNLAHAWLGEESTAIFAVISVSQWQWVGYCMILFVVAIQAIPEELYEAARIDGASAVQQFFHITIPMIRETILVLTTITVIGGFKVFDIVWVMTAGGPNNTSNTLGGYLYRVGFRNEDLGYASALATLLFAITFALTFIQLQIGRTGKES